MISAGRSSRAGPCRGTCISRFALRRHRGQPRQALNAKRTTQHVSSTSPIIVSDDSMVGNKDRVVGSKLWIISTHVSNHVNRLFSRLQHLSPPVMRSFRSFLFAFTRGDVLPRFISTLPSSRKPPIVISLGGHQHRHINIMKGPFRGKPITKHTSKDVIRALEHEVD